LIMVLVFQLQLATEKLKQKNHVSL
jgi:hypothetical protein